MNRNTFFAVLIITFLSVGIGLISNLAFAINDPVLKGIGNPSGTFAKDGDTYIDVCTESYFLKNTIWIPISGSTAFQTTLNSPPSNLPSDAVLRNVVDAHGHVCAQGMTTQSAPVASAGVLYSQGVSNSTYPPQQTHVSINSVTRSQSMFSMLGSISVHNYTNSNTTNPQGGTIGSPIYAPQTNAGVDLYTCSPSASNSKDYFCAKNIDKSSGYLCTKDPHDPLAFFCAKSEKNAQGGILSTQNYPVQASTGLIVYPCKVSIIGSQGYFCADNINTFQGKEIGSSIYYR
jgi:hypothetical protein